MWRVSEGENTSEGALTLLEHDCETLRYPLLHLQRRGLPYLSTYERSGTL